MENRNVELNKNAMADVARKLTLGEIHDIVSVIPPVQAGAADIALENHSRILEITSRQLAEIKLKPSKIEKMKAIIYNRCMRARVHPGENAGLHASESMGQPISQINLNTFHQSGAAGGEGGGINDFKRVFALTKNPNDHTKLFMSDLHFDMIDAMNVSKAFVSVPLLRILNGDVSNSVQTLTIPPNGLSDRSVFGNYYELFERFTALDETRNLTFDRFKSDMKEGMPFVRLRLDRYQLFYNRISTKDVAIAMESIGNTFCVFSPTKDAIVDVFIGHSSVAIETSLDEDVAFADFATDTDETDDEDKKLAHKIVTSTRVADFADMRNSAISFMQNALLPLIYGGSISVKSSIILKTLKRMSEEFDSMAFAERYGELPLFGSHDMVNFGSICNFKVTEIGAFQVIDVFKGATIEPLTSTFETRDDFEIWNLWINRYLCNVNGIRMHTLVRIVELVFGDLEGFSIRMADYKKGEVIRITLPRDIASPTKYMSDKIKAEQPRQITEKEEKIFFRPRRPTSELAYLAKRYSISLYDSESHTLRTLHSIPIFDRKFTFVNNFHEIYDNFGIEGARSLIISEIYGLFKSVGSFINPVHIRLTADVMTSGGFLMPITARGIANKHLGAYYDSSFEQALQAFKKAAAWGKEETVKTASSSVLFGVRCRFGTGAFRMRSTLEDEKPAHEPPLIESAGITPEAPVDPASMSRLFEGTAPPRGLTKEFFEDGFSRLSASQSETKVLDSVAMDENVTRGLENVGNSCYFNSLIQLLANAREFRKLFEGDEWRKFASMGGGSYVQGMHDLVQCLWGSRKVCNSDSFRKVLVRGDKFFASCGQEDPFEAYSKMMDLLQDDLRSKSVEAVLPFTNSVVLPITSRVDIAFGNYYSKFKEIYPSSFFDMFSILSVYTSRWEDSRCKARNRMELTNFLPITADENRTIFDLVKDELNETAQNLECEQIGEILPAKIRTTILHFPKLLVLQIKRYRQKPSGALAKSDAAIVIDDTLDLSDYRHAKLTIGGGKYRLKGVICHKGRGLNSGHYYAYVRNNNIWYNIDDESVTKIGVVDVDDIRKYSYMVMYEIIED